MQASFRSIQQTTRCLRMYSASTFTSWLQDNYGPPGISQHPSNMIILNNETFVSRGARILRNTHMSLNHGDASPCFTILSFHRPRLVQGSSHRQTSQQPDRIGPTLSSAGRDLNGQQKLVQQQRFAQTEKMKMRYTVHPSIIFCLEGSREPRGLLGFTIKYIQQVLQNQSQRFTIVGVGR